MPDSSFLQVNADVVPATVPLLISIDVLDKEMLVAYNVQNLMDSRRYCWSLPVVRSNKRMFVRWDTATLLHARAELSKLHKQLWHPYSEKLYNHLKRMKPEDTTSETL